MASEPPTFNDREKVIEMLMLAQEQDRTVLEFTRRGGELYVMEITDHVDTLEEIVNE